MPEESVAQYLYGVVRDGTSLGELPNGVQGHPVTLVADGGLAALVSDVHEGAPLGRRRDLTAHHEVLRHLAMREDVAPMQFGLVLSSPDEVIHEVLRARGDELHETLHRVAGMVQLSLRASFDEPSILREIVEENHQVRALRERTRDRPDNARDPDMLRLGELVARDVDRRRHIEAESLMRAVTPLVAQYRERDAGPSPELLEVALLVRREQVGDVEDALERIAEERHPRVRLRLTPPTAAFDFVGESSWA